MLIFPIHSQNLFYELDFKTPLVASIHDLMYYYVPKPDLTYTESTFFYQALHRRAAGVFVDSELSKRQYGELFGCTSIEKVYVLPFRIPNYLYDMDEEVVPLKNQKYIFYPAQMGEHKNHLNLILAVDFLRKENVNINLVFSGINNGIYEYIRHLIKELRLENQIEVVGFLNGAQLKYLYSHAIGNGSPDLLNDKIKAQFALSASNLEFNRALRESIRRYYDYVKIGDSISLNT